MSSLFGDDKQGKAMLAAAKKETKNELKSLMQVLGHGRKHIVEKASAAQRQILYSFHTLTAAEHLILIRIPEVHF